MSLLVIQLPARLRLAARAGTESVKPGAAAVSALAYAFSADGQQLTQAGRAEPAALPRARTVVAVLDAADVAWHALDIPKAPSGRLRAALAGVLEERLLEDEDQLHFALGAGAVAGQRGWVAVMHRPTLAAALAALDAAGLAVERVLPAARPVAEGEPLQGHFQGPADTDDAGDGAAAGTEHPADQPRLVLARADGVLCARLDGALARALAAPAPVASPAGATPDALLPAARWTATPAAAAAAEAWLGAPVTVQREPERLLALAQAALAPGVPADNLLQFDLAPRRRGSRALGSALQGLLGPRWRPVRWGLAALALVQLLGLNVYAWQQRQALQAQRQAMVDLLRETHPGVRAVLDAPLQMQRETERLRARAGRAGEADLEALLAAAAAAWPDGQGPVQTLRYESGRLTLAAPGWGPQDLAQFQQRLQVGGYTAQGSAGSVVLSRAVRG
jgi:general secretion pathway protein L